MNFIEVADDNVPRDEPLITELQAPETPMQPVLQAEPMVLLRPQTPTGPPPSRGPPQRLAQARPGPGNSARMGPRQGAYSLPASQQAGSSNWVLGAPPLNLGLAGSVVRPPGSGSPVGQPTTPGTAGSSASHLDRTPPPGVSKQARKSLTRQVDQAVADCLGTSASRVRGTDDSWAIPEYELFSPSQDGSPDNSAESVNLEDRPEGADLHTQIRSELKRRKSLGRPSTPGSYAQAPCQSLTAAVLPWTPDHCDSPATPTGRCWPLTPVREQGETPYR